MLRWILLNKLAEESGYTIKALQRKIESGAWIEGVHYRHSPDGRVHINVEAYQAWVEGQVTPALRSMERRSA